MADKDSKDMTNRQNIVISTPKLSKEGELPPFGLIHQGTATNELSKQIVLPSEAPVFDPFTGTAKIIREKIQLTFIEYNEFTGLKGSTQRLLDALVMTFTESGSKDKTIRLALRDYMELCGLKNLRETRKQVRADLWTIRRTSLTFTDKTSGEDRNYYNVSLAQAHGIVNSVIVLTLGDVFYELLRHYPTMPLHRLIFRLNPRLRPHARPLFRKIQEHKRINAGSPNEDRLSVIALLEVCPELPTYERVMEGNRNLYEAIIKPFEENLNELEEALTWEYYHRDGTPLTEDEKNNFNYELFTDLIIAFTWKEYPDQSALIEAREKIKPSKEQKKRNKRKKGKK